MRVLKALVTADIPVEASAPASIDLEDAFMLGHAGKVQRAPPPTPSIVLASASPIASTPSWWKEVRQASAPRVLLLADAGRLPVHRLFVLLRGERPRRAEQRAPRGVLRLPSRWCSSSSFRTPRTRSMTREKAKTRRGCCSRSPVWAAPPSLSGKLEPGLAGAPLFLGRDAVPALQLLPLNGVDRPAHHHRGHYCVAGAYQVFLRRGVGQPRHARRVAHRARLLCVARYAAVRPRHGYFRVGRHRRSSPEFTSSSAFWLTAISTFFGAADHRHVALQSAAAAVVAAHRDYTRGPRLVARAVPSAELALFIGYLPRRERRSPAASVTALATTRSGSSWRADRGHGEGALGARRALSFLKPGGCAGYVMVGACPRRGGVLWCSRLADATSRWGRSSCCAPRRPRARCSRCPSSSLVIPHPPWRTPA